MKKSQIIAILLVLCLIFALSACSTSSDTSSVTEASALANTTVESDDDMFTDRDCDPSYDESSATSIVFSEGAVSIDGDGASSDGTIVTIASEGTYILSGTASDGQIIVNTADNEKVQLVLNGLTLTNDDSACILVLQADKVFVTLAEGSTNSLSDTGDEYVQTVEDTNVDAVIFSKEDLTFNGSGSLTVTANYDHAIVSKDDLVFTGGTYTIQAAQKGLTGKDSVRIKAGTFTITAGDDTIHSDNEDEDKGFVYIAGGTLNLSSGDDGIHADNYVVINGGTLTITQSYEGIEGQTIDINGGTINITASDDGMNASSGSSSSEEAGVDDTMSTGNDASATEENGYTLMSNTTSGTDSNSELSNGFPGGDIGGGPGGDMGGGMMDADENCYIRITGGDIYVNADGDGIDSNGYFYMDGGTLYVDGPTSGGDSALDVGIDAQVTGGTAVFAGSSGMAETFGSESTQYSIMNTFDSVVSGGTTVTLTDSSGNVILSYTPTKDYQSVIFTSDAIADGTYTVTAGDQSSEITVSEVVTTNGSSGGFGQMGDPGSMGQGGGPGGDIGGGMGGNMPDFGNGQMPDDMPSGQMPNDNGGNFGGPGGSN